MTDLGKKSRCANEAIGPANEILRRAGRGLVDLPSDVTPGARQVAQLTAWRAAQSYAINPVQTAFEELSRLPDWSGKFLVPTRQILIGALLRSSITSLSRISTAGNRSRPGRLGINFT